MQAVNIYPSQKGIVPRVLLFSYAALAGENTNYWYHRTTTFCSFSGDPHELAVTIRSLQNISPTMIGRLYLCV